MRKDVILSYYLEPYLAKVCQRGKPVLLVDGFAGPGKYGDGEIGSPLIMCSKAQAAIARTGSAIRVYCIERDNQLFNSLKSNLGAFTFAEARNGEFTEFEDEIKRLASTHSVFIYLDPWKPAEVNWASIECLAAQIKKVSASVELLLNFNTPIFARWALSTQSQDISIANEEIEDADEFDSATSDSPIENRLTEVVGGVWWKSVLGKNYSFEQLTENVIRKLEDSLRMYFSEVCWVSVRDNTNRNLKYHMIFGSRHPDALELMNDAMVKARGESDFQVDLFAQGEMDELILKLAPTWITRRLLMLATIRQAFCRCLWKDIRGRIEQLLKEGRLESQTGKTRINDETFVRSITSLSR